MMYFHGTNIEGILAIIDSGFVGVEYFDGYGFYVTDDIECAKIFGHHILVFDSLNENSLETDDTNDGVFHRGKIPKDQITTILIADDDRYIRDLVKYSKEPLKTFFRLQLLEKKK